MTTSYVTQGTEWPSAAIIPDDVQKLIALFYETADSKNPKAGQVLAENVFSENGSLVSASGVFTGFDGALSPSTSLREPRRSRPGPRKFPILVVIELGFTLYCPIFVRADGRSMLQRLESAEIMPGAP
jgi:hypothetical protein